MTDHRTHGAVSAIDDDLPEVTTDTPEKVAFRKFFDDMHANVDWDWGKPRDGDVLVDAVFDLDKLLATLAEARSRVARPSGTVVVPVKPTKAMIDAGIAAAEGALDTDFDSDRHGNRYSHTELRSDAPAEIYAAMIAKAGV